MRGRWGDEAYEVDVHDDIRDTGLRLVGKEIVLERDEDGNQRFILEDCRVIEVRGGPSVEAIMEKAGDP